MDNFRAAQKKVSCPCPACGVNGVSFCCASRGKRGKGAKKILRKIARAKLKSEVGGW